MVRRVHARASYHTGFISPQSLEPSILASTMCVYGLAGWNFPSYFPFKQSTYLGPKGHAAPHNEGRASAPTAGIARALLLVGLAATSAHLPTRQGAGCTLRRGTIALLGATLTHCTMIMDPREVENPVTASDRTSQPRVQQSPATRTALMFCRTVMRYRCTKPLLVSGSATMRERFCVPDSDPSHPRTVIGAAGASKLARIGVGAALRLIFRLRVRGAHATKGCTRVPLNAADCMAQECQTNQGCRQSSRFQKLVRRWCVSISQGRWHCVESRRMACARPRNWLMVLADEVAVAGRGDMKDSKRDKGDPRKKDLCFSYFGCCISSTDGNVERMTAVCLRWT